MKTLFAITDRLPIIGGAAGGVAGERLADTHYIPTIDAIVVCVILAAVGAVVGFFVNMLLKWAIERDNAKKEKR